MSQWLIEIEIVDHACPERVCVRVCVYDDCRVELNDKADETETEKRYICHGEGKKNRRQIGETLQRIEQTEKASLSLIKRRTRGGLSQKTDDQKRTADSRPWRILSMAPGMCKFLFVEELLVLP